jgi:hypothetical protein
VYGRLEGKSGKMCEGGRDLEGRELVVEYCDKRFLEACDMGRGRLVLRAGGDVMSGGRAGCAVFRAGGDEMAAGGEVAGDEPGDMTAVMVRAEKATSTARNNQWGIARSCGGEVYAFALSSCRWGLTEEQGEG